jgi:hypothetical protein
MAIEFSESFILEFPKLDDKLDRFNEHDFQESHGLIVEVAAIHEGVTNNYTYYPAQELEKALESWFKPYPKPVILNHDVSTEPLGRVLGAKMDKEADGTPYVRLQMAITDPSAIQKIKDKRYLTGSIGGKAEKAICSISGDNIAESAPKFKRGKHYKGKLVYLIMEGISFKEYSFVNMPSDERLSVISIQESIDTQEAWVNSARFFVLDLDEEHITEFSESDNHDILGDMKKKDASSLYRSMKGAFIEAQVVNKMSEDVAKSHINDTNVISDSKADSEENNMTKETAEQKPEDDILDAVEGLAEEDVVEEELQEEAPETEESVEEELAEESVDEEIEEDAIEEATRPEGQEKPTGDVNANTSEGAPKNRESEEEDSTDETVEVEEEVTETADDVESSEEEVEESDETEETDTELDEQESIEPRVEDSDARIAALEEENSRLKRALHRYLAEKVVDRKISVGMETEENRGTSIEEHATRSASSLADTLRDLQGVQTSAIASSEQLSEMLNDKSMAVADGEKSKIDESDVEVEVISEDDKAIKAMTDRLMGRSNW